MIKNVAILGAGAAGLMAALDLRDAGNRVTVFEARDRVGGRIHTIRFSDGRIANAGAEWLNSSDSLARSVVERYGLELVERFGFEALVEGGEPVLEENGYEVIDDAFDAVVASLTNVQEPWNDPVARRLDLVSVAEWSYRTGADADTIHRFFVDIEGEFMAPVTEISMAAVAVSAASTNNDRAYRLREGTASLPEAMARDLGEVIHLSEGVIGVAHLGDHILVRTEHREETFDAVVITLPLPALARLRFEPSLDIPWINQGRGGKVMIPYDNASIGPATQRDHTTGMKFVYANASHQATPGAVLTAYSDHVLDPGEVTATFARWFPALIQSAIPPETAWWSLDPHSGTTYSAPQPGYLDALKRLREPFSRIVLAGEHTEILFGYVESALVSGRRAAAAILAGDV